MRKACWTLIFAAFAAPASANFGPDYFADAVAEPAPAEELDGIVVEHETLAIDLRPVADGRPAVVDVRYRLRNDGTPLSLPLIFVSPDMQAGRVKLDGADVSVDVVPCDDEASYRWRPPDKAPAIGGGFHAFHWLSGRWCQERERGAYAGLRFRADVPSGSHDLTVTYRVDPRLADTGEIWPERQIGYILSPARSWRSFGTLEVRIDVPRGWDAATAPLLSRAGDVLNGRFQGLPADALMIVVRAPIPWWTPLVDALPSTVPAAGLVFVTVILWLMVRRWRRRESAAAFLAGGKILLLAAALAIALLGIVPLVLGERLAPPGASASWRAKAVRLPQELATLVVPFTLIAGAVFLGVGVSRRLRSLSAQADSTTTDAARLDNDNAGATPQPPAGHPPAFPAPEAPADSGEDLPRVLVFLALIVVCGILAFLALGAGAAALFAVVGTAFGEAAASRARRIGRPSAASALLTAAVLQAAVGAVLVARIALDPRTLWLSDLLDIVPAGLVTAALAAVAVAEARLRMPGPPSPGR